MKTETGREKGGAKLGEEELEEEEEELEEEELEEEELEGEENSFPPLPRHSDSHAAAGENPPATSTAAPAARGATSAFTRPWTWCHGRQL